MQRILPLATLALTLGFTSAPAFAADGFYVSGAINNTTQENHQSRNTGTNEPNEGAAGGASATVVDKNTDAGFVLGLGYKKHIADDIYIAAEGFYSTESVDTTTLNNVKINHVTLNSTYGFDVKFGTDVTEKISIYGLGGLTNFDFDSAISYTFAPPKDDVSDDEWGFTYGGGVAIKLTDKLSTFGEFRLTNDLEFDTPVDRGGIQAEEELNYTILRTGLRYHF